MANQIVIRSVPGGIAIEAALLRAPACLRTKWQDADGPASSHAGGGRTVLAFAIPCDVNPQAMKQPGRIACVQLEPIPFTLITSDGILAPYLNWEAGWRARARFVSKEIG